MHERASCARGTVPRRRVASRRGALAALALGSITVAGFAPLYLYPLPIITLALLMYLWGRAPSPWRAAMLGGWFGLGFFLTGVSWVYVSLHTFGAMPAPLAAIATLAFCAFLALFPAAAGYGYAKLSAPLWVKATLLLPPLWTLTEWVRGWIFTGFPWLSLGYSQVPLSPLSGFAPVIGIFGLTLLTTVSAGLILTLAEHVQTQRRGVQRTGIPAPRQSFTRVIMHPTLMVLIALWLGGYALAQIRWTEAAGEPVSVALLQGNIPQDIKWTPEGLRTTLSTYHQLALQSSAKLIVFPETALPLFLSEVPADYLASLAEHARRNGGDVLIGVPERLPSGDYYNSLISTGSAPNQSYRKTHLVPFGEFIPLRPLLGPIVGALAIPLQDFSRGSLEPQPLAVAGQRVAINICYEDAFGEEIIRQLPAATLLTNVSNVAWFGRSIAPYQHLQISQARALETGRYMLRATNTGITAIVNERGNVVKAAPQFATAVVNGMVQGYRGTTPYVRWGNYAILTLCIVLIAAAMLVSGTSRA